MTSMAFDIAKASSAEKRKIATFYVIAIVVVAAALIGALLAAL